MMHVPARDIPVPTSVSPQAQAMLARGPLGPAPVWPPLDDPDAWRAAIAAMDASSLTMLGSLAEGFVTDPSAADLTEIDVDGVAVYVVTPNGLDPDDRRVFLDIHGGAWVLGGGKVCRTLAPGRAAAVGARVWAVDYRMPPDHPHPTPLDDCLAAYRALLADHRPEDIVVGGQSAGGTFATALMLRARDEGLPLPAALVLDTPAVDLTASGDSLNTNLGVDTVLTGRADAPMRLYAGDHDLRDPYVSPLFGDFAKGFPPTILLTGTRDLLLSDTVRLHARLRAAGQTAELHVFEAAGHGNFLGMAPEDQERAGEVRRFIDRAWAAGR